MYVAPVVSLGHVVWIWAVLIIMNTMIWGGQTCSSIVVKLPWFNTAGCLKTMRLCPRPDTTSPGMLHAYYCLPLHTTCSWICSAYTFTSCSLQSTIININPQRFFQCPSLMVSHNNTYRLLRLGSFYVKSVMVHDIEEIFAIRLDEWKVNVCKVV